jgi:hypothetical protein
LANRIKQAFFHYLQWEDYKAGMYKKTENDPEKLITQSIELFSDKIKLKIAMNRVVREWPISTLHNFSNGGLNRRSWLGQAACCIDHGIPEIINRNAWNSLTEQQMKAANKIADGIINNWEIEQLKNEKVFRIKCIRSGTYQGVLDF